MPAQGDLRGLGIEPGQRVRFRGRSGGRWREGQATGIERDGSIAVREAKGMARAIAVERIEVRMAGRRGTTRWIPMAEVAARTEQLGLF